jgi:hypothetical protein
MVDRKPLASPNIANFTDRWQYVFGVASLGCFSPALV